MIARTIAGMIPVAAAVALIAASNSLTVKMRDDCDPATFNAAVGPGTCVGNGDTTFQEFTAELAKEGQVGDWRLNPDRTKVDPGTTITLNNRGGETHTFTRVAEFGGGFIPQLNGNLTPRPECAQAPGVPQPPGPNNIFVPSGMTMAGPTLTTGGTVKFQCCIHPWMHSEITVK
jgi:plastocyanin